ncbi:myozenin-2-like [Megalops cyprinoides]|uniref:myozenin-2-like n=1 Tax=Megalops cyprinoides TaxID=118141 RepID=UPI001864762E|nr:myozenin-2-like [Megalops cyprinoides]XP_036404766.1 myozenin-2-like [Megalops cyprinoides]
MQTSNSDLTRQRKQQAMTLSKEARGEHLNLGKKINVPKDVMVEELHLPSNRGSLMFQERMRRVEKYTVENTADAPTSLPDLNQFQVTPDTQEGRHREGGKENVRTEVFIRPPGKQSLVTTLKQTVAKKGNPNVLAPGYSGPLKEIPREKFNITVVPKSYCSPWREALGESEELLATLNVQLPEPPQRLQPANYRCFNRVPMPFGGHAGAKRFLPVPGVELLDTQPEPTLNWNRVSKRPNFNRAPRGWGVGPSHGSTDL